VTTDDPIPTPTSGSKQLALSFVEFVALTGVLVAQPVFDLLRTNASILILWGLNGWQLVLFVLAIVAGPAAMFCAIEAIAGAISPRARWPVHVALVGVLTLSIAVVVANKVTDLEPLLIVAIATLAVAGFMVLFVRYAVVRTWLRYLALMPVVLGVAFAGMSPATDIAFGTASFADVQPSNPARVVVVVFDELPTTSMLDGHGNIDASLFPNFAALARGANWYRNDTTVAPFTEAAIPAILTGRYPKSQFRVPDIAEYPQNLFTLLGQTYEMNVHEPRTHLCPQQVCTSVVREKRGLGVALHDSYNIWRDFIALNPVAFSLHDPLATDLHPVNGARKFIDSIQPTSRPRLDFLHVLLPHFPWHYLDTTQDYASLPIYENGLDPQLRWRNDWVATLSYQKHLLQAQASDTLLGRIIARLKDVGAYDGSMIVVTADHGASFVGGQLFRGVTATTYPEIMWTPLLMKLPDQHQGTIDDRPASSIDIVPTIADVLGVRVPWEFDGTTLLGPAQPDGPRRLLDWGGSAIHPVDGTNYLTVDGPAGFQTVMKAVAMPPDPNPALRLYRISEFGSMVGRPVKEFDVQPSAEPLDVSIDVPQRYQTVDLDANKAPWASLHGTVNIREEDVPLALAVNGRIAAIYKTYGAPKGGRTDFWGMIPPSLLRQGRNTLEFYALSGTPAEPRLHPTHLQ
jgi:hypothetical protein